MSSGAQVLDWSKDWAEDSLRNYALALLAMWEICVREGMYSPMDEREVRQAQEGPVRMLDCVKDATAAMEPAAPSRPIYDEPPFDRDTAIPF